MMALSVTEQLSFWRPSTKSVRLIVVMTSPFALTEEVAKSWKMCNMSAFSIPQASEISSSLFESSSTDSNSSRVSVSVWSASRLRKISWSFNLDRRIFSLSESSSISARCFSVALIIFSLTTAVRIDRMAQEEMTMKTTQNSLAIGMTSKSGSKSPMSPFITLKSTYIDSGTFGKILATSLGAGPPNTKPCPTSETHTMAQM
mmetsp:Transcript_92522/g.285653  ORF Transcript_92522/g.285653 Transcript_92522/m.285653 type:complete len:202 (-) Transcript_92522:273-878(-)